MTCARREAGAHRPAPSTGWARRPDPRSGHRRARLFRFLPVLALLLDALSPFAAPPVKAQTVTLVSNCNQTIGASYSSDGWINVQAFTAGI